MVLGVDVGVNVGVGVGVGAYMHACMHAYMHMTQVKVCFAETAMKRQSMGLGEILKLKKKPMD